MGQNGMTNIKKTEAPMAWYLQKLFEKNEKIRNSGDEAATKIFDDITKNCEKIKAALENSKKNNRSISMEELDNWKEQLETNNSLIKKGVRVKGFKDATIEVMTKVYHYSKCIIERIGEYKNMAHQNSEGFNPTEEEENRNGNFEKMKEENEKKYIEAKLEKKKREEAAAFELKKKQTLNHINVLNNNLADTNKSWFTKQSSAFRHFRECVSALNDEIRVYGVCEDNSGKLAKLICAVEAGRQEYKNRCDTVRKNNRVRNERVNLTDAVMRDISFLKTIPEISAAMEAAKKATNGMTGKGILNYVSNDLPQTVAAPSPCC